MTDASRESMLLQPTAAPAAPDSEQDQNRDLAKHAETLEDSFLRGDDMDATKLKALNCAVCRHLVASSLVLSCGHMFCGACLYTHVLEKTPSCPSCKVGFRAVPVRCLALDSVAEAFVQSIPKFAQSSYQKRAEDGKSAASSLNKMLPWLQPPFIPGFGDGSSNNSTGQPVPNHAHPLAAATQSAANQMAAQMATAGQQQIPPPCPPPLPPRPPLASRVHQVVPGAAPMQQQLHHQRPRGTSLDDIVLAAGLGGAGMGGAGMTSISSGGALMNEGGHVVGNACNWEGLGAGGSLLASANHGQHIQLQQRVGGAGGAVHPQPAMMMHQGFGSMVPQPQHFYARSGMPSPPQPPLGFDPTFQQQSNHSQQQQVLQQLANMGVSSEFTVKVLHQMQQLKQQQQMVQGTPNLYFAGGGAGDNFQMAQMQQIMQALGFPA